MKTASRTTIGARVCSVRVAVLEWPQKCKAVVPNAVQMFTLDISVVFRGPEQVGVWLSAKGLLAFSF
jgi:hypothetical protein